MFLSLHRLAVVSPFSGAAAAPGSQCGACGRPRTYIQPRLQRRAAQMAVNDGKSLAILVARARAAEASTNHVRTPPTPTVPAPRCAHSLNCSR